MPPKNKSDGSKKTQEKVKQKIVEDKTFGLKNKKGKKQQSFIKNVQQQVQGQPKKVRNEEPKVSKKELEKQKLAELNELFKPVQAAQKISAGADPKSVLCSFYKQGLCGKGDKCKFSHDLSLERKSEKRNIYEDEREGKEDMTDWDQATLEEVVNKKHGESNDAKPKTDIICKFFLDAVEKSVYGWFWTCPNGDKCIYRHALPPGFVLKKDKKKEEDAKDQISLEELIEHERASLSGDLTPVTLETFLVWKKRKIEEKKEKLALDMKRKKEEFKSGMSKASGKEVFLFKPELANADDDEATDDMSIYQREEQDQENDSRVVELSLESLAAQASMVDDGKATKASTLSVRDRETARAPPSSSMVNGLEINESSGGSGLDMACGGAENLPDDGGGNYSADGLQPVVLDGVPVDESLFEDIDDLDIEDE